MILVSTNKMAMCAFPCEVYIECVSTEPDEHGVPQREWRIMAGSYTQVVMGKYSNPAPAKMELQRLLTEWNHPETMRPEIFEFVKEVS